MVSRWTSNRRKIAALMQASRIVWVQEIGQKGGKNLCRSSSSRIWTFYTRWKRKINSSIYEEVQLNRIKSLYRPTKATIDQLRMLQAKRLHHPIKSLHKLIRSATEPKYIPNCNWKVKTNWTREEQVSSQQRKIKNCHSMRKTRIMYLNQDIILKHP